MGVLDPDYGRVQMNETLEHRIHASDSATAQVHCMGFRTPLGKGRGSSVATRVRCSIIWGRNWFVMQALNSKNAALEIELRKRVKASPY